MTTDMNYCSFWAITFLLLASAGSINGFSTVQSPQQGAILASSRQSMMPLYASRYGPPLDDIGKLNDKDDEEMLQSQRMEFGQLLDKVMTASKPEHIPSLLTKHLELILKMQGDFAVETVKDILEKKREKGGEEEVERAEEAIEIILSFAEDFVEKSKNLDDHNKNLLGKIIRTMTEASGSDREKEENLDELLVRERDNFTRGFLRHLDGECERIASASTLSPEGSKLQEILMVIKTRIVEELGKELGEGALVLGQLVAYEDKQERMAVLDAGLTVRGLDFAVELGALTEEALQGFQSVPDGADPTLVSRVEEIDGRVRSFIEENNNFQ